LAVFRQGRQVLKVNYLKSKHTNTTKVIIMSNKITIEFPDGSKKEYDKGVKPEEIVKGIGPRLADAALAAKVNNSLFDMNRSIEENAKVEFITYDTHEGQEVFHHSSAHLMAMAILKLYPAAKLTIGPTVEGGFYYDIDIKPLKPSDLERIEKQMQKFAEEDHPFVRQELNKAEALKIFKDNPFKIELIEEFAEEGQKLSIYKNGDFIDLCRGPHIVSTAKIKAFKLTKVSGAYWRGDAKSKPLQRIYGVSFPDKKQLNAYLKRLEEAEKRDHRKIGKQLELYSFHDEAPGCPFFLPKGMVIWNELMKFWREEHQKAGYVEFKTPIILNRVLWEKSGHWENYRENMYTTKIDNQDFAVKPMNCPGGMLIYNEKVHSYRELPIRAGEVGLVHRHELSGTLAGLFRVRCFHQDDAHIFMTEDQIVDEVLGVLNLVDRFYKVFNLSYYLELSTRPEKSIGSDKDWELTTSKLKEALDKSKKPYKINPGDGAFYGPKIDVHVTDAIGRTWQCATIQLDMSLPERFDMTYEGKDGTKHRPVMIHRVIYGALERFIGIIVEHFAGRFPLWFAPVQAVVLTVSEKFNGYGTEIHKKLVEAGIRAEMDFRTESVGRKVRDAQLQKIPLIINVGEKEEQKQTIAVRTLDGKLKFDVKLDEFIDTLKKNISEKKLELDVL